jgi:hypothetical protein
MGAIPDTLDTLTMLPPPRSAMGSMTALMPRNAPVRFTESTCSKVSLLQSASIENSRIPALLTSASTPPNSPMARLPAASQSRGFPVLLLGDVEVQVARRGPDGFRHGLALVVAHVSEHHAGALVGEEPRLGLALTACGTGDDHDLVVQASHGALLRVVAWA